MRVYLTGGSGLVGSHVAERLRARGDDVVCLQRKGSRTGHLEALGCRIVHGDVRDGAEALHRDMGGCDALVHAAALVYVGGPWPRLRAVNVEGTTNAVRAAAAAGIGRVLHVSSVAVYGRTEGPVDENRRLDTPLDPAELYARSKREAETAARAAANAGHVALVIVRPAAMYGERDRLLTPRLAAVARLPVIPMLGPGENTMPVVYAGNAADALVSALDAGRDGRVYDLGMDHPLTQKGMLEGMARARGRRPRLLSLPAGCVRQGARLGETLRLNLPGAGDLTLERLARLSLGENPYRSERIRSELRWRPPFTHEEGFRRTAAWLEASSASRRRETG